MNNTIKSFDQCDCSCASFCPLNRTGMSIRCTLFEVASYFNCKEDDALKYLHRYQNQVNKPIISVSIIDTNMIR